SSSPYADGRCGARPFQIHNAQSHRGIRHGLSRWRIAAIGKDAASGWRAGRPSHALRPHRTDIRVQVVEQSLDSLADVSIGKDGHGDLSRLWCSLSQAIACGGLTHTDKWSMNDERRRPMMGRWATDVTAAELAVLQVLWDCQGSTARQLIDRLYPDGG